MNAKSSRKTFNSLSAAAMTAFAALVLAAAPARAGSLPQGSFDECSGKIRAIHVKGWTYDPDVPSQSSYIIVRLYSDSGCTRKYGNDIYLAADQPRPDVNQAKGIAGNHGFDADIPVDVGTYWVMIVAFDTDGFSQIGSTRSVTAQAGLPQSALDECSGKTRAIHVKGWTYDPDVPSQSSYIIVRLYSDSGCTRQYGNAIYLVADQPRPDVNQAKGIEGNHGFDADIPVDVGTYWVMIVAIDTTNDGFPQIGSTRSVTVTRGRVRLWEGGPYWADSNIGADQPWDWGWYFWWGDTVGYKRENDAWVASDGSSSNFSFDFANTSTRGKDNATLKSEGWITADGVLAPAHDAAHVKWGGDWRMPNYHEFYYLSQYCDWTRTTTNGVNGYVVRGRGDYASNSIFLPCAGYGDGNSLNQSYTKDCFWSSVPDDVSTAEARCLEGSGAYHNYRKYGYSVRPVLSGTVAISFSANGGDVSFSSDLYIPGEPYDLLPTATCVGFTFEGWFTAADGGTLVTTSSTVPASATTLYAHWTGSQYTVTLDRQGGSGGTESVTVTYGSPMPPIAVPRRKGYIFGGYYNRPNGIGTQFYTASGASLWDSSTWNWLLTGASGRSATTLTLYAKWTPSDACGMVRLWTGGPFWATVNVGADEPWDYGWYFWWGDTVGYSRDNDAWVASDGSTSDFSFDSGNVPTYGKANATLQSEGWITADGVLASAHDAAQAHWGGDWRMPTSQESYDLCNTYCDWTLTTTNGVIGYVVRGRGEYSSASIFIPAARYGDGTSLIDNANVNGVYWSSVPHSVNRYSNCLLFYSDPAYPSASINGRYFGCPVRPVQTSAPINLSTLTGDYTAADGDVLTNMTAYTVKIPGGATVMLNSVPVTGGGTVSPAPEFAAGGEAAITEFTQGAGGTWGFTAFAELANDAVGADVADAQVSVYCGDAVDGVTNAVSPTITQKTSAVKVEMTVEVPSSAPQFFHVGFASAPSVETVVSGTDARCMVRLWAGGPLWAETNIGADEPWDYGYYFWWGDTVGYKRENDAWVASDGSSSNFSFERGNAPTCGKLYATLQSEGWITADGVLAPEHDAAQAHWGGDWRMPTLQELSDLNNNCDWTWTTTNGVSGHIVRGRGNYSAASIFIPASGSGYDTSLSFGYTGSSGTYWSSDTLSDDLHAWFLTHREGYHAPGGDGRYYGCAVRPVWRPAPIDLSTLSANYTTQEGDVLNGETAYNVTVPGGVTVTINGVRIAGCALPAPAFAAGCEATNMTFAKGLGNTWTLTAFAELANDAVGADIADGAIKVYRGDTEDGVTNAVVPTITGKKSAVKVEMTVDAPADASQQFFKVKFGE